MTLINKKNFIYNIFDVHSRTTYEVDIYQKYHLEIKVSGYILSITTHYILTITTRYGIRLQLWTFSDVIQAQMRLSSFEWGFVRTAFEPGSQIKHIKKSEINFVAAVRDGSNGEGGNVIIKYNITYTISIKNAFFFSQLHVSSRCTSYVCGLTHLKSLIH